MGKKKQWTSILKCNPFHAVHRGNSLHQIPRVRIPNNVQFLVNWNLIVQCVYIQLGLFFEDPPDVLEGLQAIDRHFYIGNPINGNDQFTFFECTYLLHINRRDWRTITDN